MKEELQQKQNSNPFWTTEKKADLQKEFDTSFKNGKQAYTTPVNEAALLTSVALIGALLAYTLNKENFDLNSQLLFIGALTSAGAFALRGAKKKAMVQEVLSANALFSFFNTETDKCKTKHEVNAIYQESDRIIDLMFFKKYQPTKKIATVSSIALLTGALTSCVQSGLALTTGAGIFCLTTAYDLFNAKKSIKQTAHKLPKGVYIPCLKKEHTKE